MSIEIDWGFALAELLVVLVLLAPAIVRALRRRRFQQRCERAAERRVCGICGGFAICQHPRYGMVCGLCYRTLRAGTGFDAAYERLNRATIDDDAEAEAERRKRGEK